MAAEFPYQIVIFLDRIPNVGEPVYYGKNGWYAQVAIKRRFTFVAGDEDTLVELLKSYFCNVRSFTIETGSVKSNELLPVRFIEIESNEVLFDLHNTLIAFLGDKIVSRYPERDGTHYYPHVTAEYNGEDVIDVQHYSERKYGIRSAWLLKDVLDENSIAMAQLAFSSDSSDTTATPLQY